MKIALSVDDMIVSNSPCYLLTLQPIDGARRLKIPHWNPSTVASLEQVLSESSQSAIGENSCHEQSSVQIVDPF